MTATPIRAAISFSTLGVLTMAVLALHWNNASPPKLREPWKTGFWIWAGEQPASTGFEAQIVYVEAPGNQWPHDLPVADQYIVVKRIEPGPELTSETASSLVESYKALTENAGNRVNIAGLQIDYDCPTNRLETYGRFLKQVRSALPQGTRLSITALLDWFSPRTNVQSALRWVDEFVPQFYDAGPSRSSAGIAEPIDVQKWAPVFNAYEVPYRIGISSFGRIARRRTDGSGHSAVQYFRDASPMDFAGRRELARSTSATPAGELVVHYDVVTPIEGKPELIPGDTVDITLPTEASVRAASDAAHRFGGYSAGILFFRWPSRSETMALLPGDVQRIVSGESPAGKVSLEVEAPPCIDRQCSDLYLDLGPDVSDTDRAIAIRAIGPVELFLPDGPLHPLALRASRIGVHVPAYAGLGKVYLGRAISSGPVRFEVVPQ